MTDPYSPSRHSDLFPDGLPRRAFLKLTAAAAAGFPLAVRGQTAPGEPGGLGAEDAAPPALNDVEGPPAAEPSDRDAGYVRVLLRAPDGSPLDDARVKTLFARDLAGDPLPVKISFAEGRAHVALSAEPLQISVRLAVPGFGEVFCNADNGGKGYAAPGNVDFEAEAAETRRRRIREAAETARRGGLPADDVLDRDLAAAARPIPEKPAAVRTAASYEALAAGLRAGERLVLEAARRRIARLPAPRKGFLFGCMVSGFDRLGPEFEKRFAAAFDLATVGWYWWKPEPDEADPVVYDRMDASVDWCLARKIVPRGFGYVYLTPGAVPEWMKKRSFDGILPVYRRVVEQTCRRFDGRVPVVEVINEAHDKANLWDLSHAQIVEITREACAAARRGSLGMRRLINHCCHWAEYAKRPNADGSRRWSPWRYLKDVIAGGAEFEVIGLQWYFPQQDLFEIDRMLERYLAFGKPIHVTEVGCNSADGLDPACMGPKRLVPGWRGPWTETMQADWLEALDTLCYSRPEFEAVTWWDFVDAGGHFWPYGGLLHKDLSPKESYLRLLDLRKRWGLPKVF